MPRCGRGNPKPDPKPNPKPNPRQARFETGASLTCASPLGAPTGQVLGSG